MDSGRLDPSGVTKWPGGRTPAEQPVSPAFHPVFSTWKLARVSGAPAGEMRPERRVLAREPLGARYAPQCRGIVAASIPPLPHVGCARQEQRRARSPRLALGEALGVQETFDRPARQPQSASDLPDAPPLVMLSWIGSN